MTHQTIKKGSKGDAVKLAQKRLKKRWYDPGPVDGMFGAKTDRAARYYQLDRKLEADGVIGPATWERLDPPTVKRGATGAPVKMLQTLLSDYGYEPGTVDGAFGAKTEKAVKAFQADFGLEADGIAGPDTWAMLGS